MSLLGFRVQSYDGCIDEDIARMPFAQDGCRRDESFYDAFASNAASTVNFKKDSKGFHHAVYILSQGDSESGGCYLKENLEMMRSEIKHTSTHIFGPDVFLHV